MSKTTKGLWRTSALLGTAWASAHLLLRPQHRARPRIVSHRGAAALAPENTLSAVLAGVEAGASLIEVDVQTSVDGELIVFHDARLERTTNGSGFVTEQPWDLLRQLDAGSWFDPAFASEPIPRLSLILAALADWPGTLALEAKDPQRSPGLREKLARAIERHGFEERATVLSFDHAWLARFRRRMPQVPVRRLGIWQAPGSAWPPAAGVGLHWLAPVLDPTLGPRLRARGEELWVWTLNDVRLMRWMAWLGVDGITSDDPRLKP